MYGREIDGQVHSFGVSGKLIMNALVMYDHQTRTLWSQFLRKGVKGPLAGLELPVFQVTQTTKDLWRNVHPGTLVLDKQGRYQRDSYSSYYQNGSTGVLGETVRDSRLDRKELVVGVDLAGETKAYPSRVLEVQPVVNDSFAGQDILIVFDGDTDTALVFDRNVAGATLTFRLSESQGPLPILIDNETGSRWLALTGTALDGPMRGETLDQPLSHLAFWFAWKDWNPNTEVYSG